MNRDRSAGTALAAGSESLVVITLHGSEYAVPTDEVREVLRMVAITALPGAPPWLAGIIDLRGRVVPVVDLRIRLGFPDGGIDLSTPILIVEVDGLVAGLIADSVRGMTAVGCDAVTGHDDPELRASFVRAVGRDAGRLILIADVRAVCAGVAAYVPAGE